jgi:hypothetical protein
MRLKSMAVRLRSNGLIKLINLTPINGKGLDLISGCFWCVQAQPFGEINVHKIRVDPDNKRLARCTNTALTQSRKIK